MSDGLYGWCDYPVKLYHGKRFKEVLEVYFNKKSSRHP
jgi:hypothetical protein